MKTAASRAGLAGLRPAVAANIAERLKGLARYVAWLNGLAKSINQAASGLAATDIIAVRLLQQLNARLTPPLRGMLGSGYWSANGLQQPDVSGLTAATAAAAVSPRMLPIGGVVDSVLRPASARRVVTSSDVLPGEGSAAPSAPVMLESRAVALTALALRLAAMRHRATSAVNHSAMSPGLTQPATLSAALAAALNGPPPRLTGERVERGADVSPPDAAGRFATPDWHAGVNLAWYLLPVLSRRNVLEKAARVKRAMMPLARRVSAACSTRPPTGSRENQQIPVLPDARPAEVRTTVRARSPERPANGAPNGHLPRDRASDATIWPLSLQAACRQLEPLCRLAAGALHKHLSSAARAGAFSPTWQIDAAALLGVLTAAQPAIGIQPPIRLSPALSGPAGQRQHAAPAIQQQTHITIYGATDAQQAGREVAERQLGVNARLVQTLTTGPR